MLAAAGRLVVGVCVLVAVATTAFPAAVASRGQQLLVVLSGSMTPTFRAGDVVLVSHPGPAGLRRGMVVSFHAPGSPQRLTTHRIHRLVRRPEGLFLQTKGDANRTPDPDFTPAGSVVGVMGGSVPHAGRLLSVAQSPLGKLVLLGTPLVALLLGQLRWLLAGRGPGRRTVALGAGVLLVAVGGGVASSRLTGATFTGVASAAGNAFTTRAFCTSSSGYAARVLSSGPALRYRLGEASGTTADDTGSNNRDGTYQGSPALGQDGAIKCDTNDAVGFDGVDDYVSSANRVAAPTSATVELWFRTTVGGGVLIGYGSSTTGTSATSDRLLYLTDGGQLVAGWGSGMRTATSPASYLDDRWHMVAASFGTSGIRLYVDGALVTSTTSATTGLSFTGSWRVGTGNAAAWPSRPTNPSYTGLLDEVAVFTSQLSASTISAQYAANAA